MLSLIYDPAALLWGAHTPGAGGTGLKAQAGEDEGPVGQAPMGGP